MKFQVKFMMFVIPILLVGFLLFVLPDKAFSQPIGCCQNMGVNCAVGNSNDGGGAPQQGTEAQCNAAGGIGWTAQEICVAGNPCQPGCCLVDEDGSDTCQVPIPLVGNCPQPGNVGVGAQCDIPECTPPPDEGCCVHGDNDCTDNQTSAQCTVPPNVELVLETACSGVPQCNVPPPGEGCCVIGENNCVDDQTEGECDGLGGTLDEDVACADVPQCNLPLGCCVIGDNDCVGDQTMGECDGLGGTLDEDVACADVPQCNLPPPGEGCCVIGDNNCLNDQTLDECNSLDGELEEGVSCDFVPECNVMPPPVTNVPTISQWGLIATAIMLGLFSLITVRRAFRINNK